MYKQNLQQKIFRTTSSFLVFVLVFGATFNFLPQPVIDQAGKLSYEPAISEVVSYEVPAPKVWNATDWSTYDIITIGADNIDENLTDFPVYVDLANLSTGFWDTINTGGSDIRVTTDDGSPIELPREIVSASTTAKTGELHFKANSISSTTDTIFRIYYNGTTTLDYADDATYGAQNVWTNDYVGVWHLGEEGNTNGGGYRDSTANAHDGTGTSMTSASDVSAVMGNGQNFDGTADYINIGDTGLTFNDVTISTWAKVASGDAQVCDGVIFNRSTSASGINVGSCQDLTRAGYHWLGESNTYSWVGGPTYPTDQWFYTSFVLNNTAASIYVNDSSSINSVSHSAAAFDDLIFGADVLSTNRHFKGELDEIRIASSTRSAAWIKAEYTNQKKTSDFYSVRSTTITSGSDPASTTIAPGSPTITDSFTFQADSPGDTITSVTVAHTNPSTMGLIEIVSDNGNTVYGSISNPTGTSSVITLSTNTLTVGASQTAYKIRVTPKSHADLSSGNEGALYSISTHIVSWTGTHVAMGSDTSNTFIIDNQSLPSFGILGSLSFTSKADYAAGSNPFDVISADFNNDGHADLAVANYSSNFVSVFLNNGDGTFATRVNYTTGTNPSGVTTADFNNDGHADLAVANYGSASVSVFLNNGDGTFATRINYTTGTNPYSVTTADFNNDGHADLAVANYGSGSVSIFLNNGNGTFATKADYAAAAGSYRVTTADFNNDGHADLAVSNISPNSVSVLINNGNGTFATKVDYTTGTNPYGVTAADFNNDGHADLAVANYASNFVSVFLNNGDGTFATRVDYTANSGPFGVTTADINNDGDTDLVVANYGSASVSVFLNNGDGTFATRVNYTAGNNPRFATTADFNNDGYVDIAAANYNVNSNSVSVFLNNSTPSLTTTSGSKQPVVSYITPSQSDLNSILILRSTNAITDVPVGGTTYTVGDTIGSATVGCIDTTVVTSTADSCTVTGLNAGAVYYLKAFVKDDYGNYSTGMVPIGSPITTPQDPAEVWNASAWTTYDKITIDASQVDSTLSDFPIYVDLSDLSDSFWNTTDGNYPGVDIRVTTDDGSPIELPRELVSISTTTKTGELHFKANNISSTTDTTFRIYYNGTTTTEYTDSSTYGANNVWTNDYIAVWHMNEDPSVDSIVDSTGNGHHGTAGGSMTSGDSVESTVGKGIEFDGVNDVIDVGIISKTFNDVSISSWAKAYSYGGGNYGRIFHSEALFFWVEATNRLAFQTNWSSGVSEWNTSDGTIPFNESIYMYAGMTDALNVSSDAVFYLNGESKAGTDVTPAGTFNGNIGSSYIGNRSATDRTFNGVIDELRIASTTRSAAWVKAEYTNQKETAGFYRVNRDVAQTWNVNAWTTYDTITISASKVDANLTDFPVYVDLSDLSDSFWNTTDGNYPGVDIRVTTDDGTPIELPRELVAASSTAKTGELHFKANSISSTTDTTFRVYYNGTTTIDYKDNSTYGANNVWTNGYVGVWHLGEGNSTASNFYKDSTSNGYYGSMTDADGNSSAITGPVAGAVSFSTSDFITTAVLSDKIVSTDMTLSGWTYSPNNPAAHTGYFGLRNNSSDFYVLHLKTTNNIEGRFTNSSGVTHDVTSPTPSVVPNQWNYSTLVLDGTTLRYYDNGLAEGTKAVTGSYTQTDEALHIGTTNGSYYAKGVSNDEVRLASVSRSPAWVKAEYTNQSNTRDFYTVNYASEYVYTTNGTATFEVPEGVTSVEVKVWGAGGGAGGGYTASGIQSYGGDGGAGGFANGTIDVSNLSSLQIRVGDSGKGGNTNSEGGGGGDYSGIFTATNLPLLIAGGGGGGGGAGANASYTGGAGGAGGGENGLDGGEGVGTNKGASGKGGTQSTGGAYGGSYNGTDGAAGSAYSGGGGGNGYNTNGTGSAVGGKGGIYFGGANGGSSYFGGGGGGSGYYGGGGAEAAGTGTPWPSGGGAGGGSGFASTTLVSSYTLAAGTGSTPPNTNDAYYISGRGAGGLGRAANSGLAGGDGLVIISFIKQSQVNIGDNAGGQVTNAFAASSENNVELLSFQLSSSTSSVDLKEINISISGANKVSASNFSNIALYKDVNNNAVFDSGTDTLVSTSTPVFTGKNGRITFGVDLTIAGVSNYLVVGDTSDIPVGGYITFALNKSGISKRNIVAIGNVSAIQHIRNSIGGRSFYSGGGSVGGNAPAGDGDVGGGSSGGGTGGGSVDTNTGGDTIGNEPDFNWPSAHSGAWTNAANAYDQVDGTYATAASAISNEFKNYTHGVPASDTIVGIEVKLEVSGTTAAGNIAVALSWNQGSSWTETKSTPTLTTTDAVVTLGGPSETWGRTWTAEEFSNANFSLKVTASQSSNTLRIDALQVKIYHQASGGGGGGGGGI